MGRQGKGSREPSRIAKLEVEALPAIGALPWYPRMAGPAVNGTQAQAMVMITSHICRNEMGPRPSQEVDPMGHDPSQQGTQWVTSGTRHPLSCNAPTSQLGRLSPHLKKLNQN